MTQLTLPLRWPGSKARMANRILAQFPSDSKAYLEPYFGSGAVLFAKDPWPVEIVNDLDSELVNFFRTLRDPDTAARLVDALFLTPYARDEYAESQMISDDPVERARRFFVRTNQKLQLRHKGTWAKTYRARSSFNGSADRFVDMADGLWDVAQRLRTVQIENTDALKLIARVTERNPNTCIYADPPYLYGIRTHQSIYEEESLDLSHHVDLAAVLKDHPGPVVVSGYDNEVYDDLYADWRRVEVSTWANGQRGDGAVNRRTEVLWCNASCVVEGEPYDLLEEELS